MASAAQAKAVELQLQMRHNAEDLHDFLRDMEAWEGDIKIRDAQLRGAQAGGDAASAQNLPPVRNKDLRRKKRKKIDNTASDCIENGVKHGKSEARIKSCDYSAWDKFDVEKAAAEADRGSTPECETEEDEDEEVAEQKQYEELRAKQQALIEKDKGNEYFKTGDYDAANDCYTRGMEADPHNALLPANRAMAFLKLKKYELAESDCNLAIQLDPSYPKAFARRGAARLALNKLKEAREDFEAVLTFDPVNKQAIAELKKIKEMIEKTAKSGASQTSVTTPRQDAAGIRESTSVSVTTLKPEAAETEPSNVVQPFTRQPHLRSKKPLRRMTIEQVGSDMQPKMVQSVEGTGLNAEGVHTPPLPPQPPPPAAQPQPSSAGVRDCGKEEKKVQASVKVADGEEAEATGGAVVGDEGDTRRHGNRRVTGSEQPGVILSVAARDEGRTQQRLPNTQKGTPMTSDLAQTVSVPPPPSNSFQLESDLRQLKGRPNLLYQYIKQIAPIAFPQIMQQPLEPDVLYKLLNVLKESYIPHEDKALIFAVLHNLSLVRRFDMAVMFMSTTEKAVARALFDHIASAEDISGASVTALKTKYSL
ncbi:RNA polymerase II-associated protein 3 isoform X1 [Petromyzon marinus]|uniref:RNA polymerase II-associated protein 3 isoform X1 n=1 Tax=Petromyzon marinus TaxID=7757 RepID=UPI003F71E537